MKKTYSAPAIKVSKIDTESLMLSISGDTGSKIGNSTTDVKAPNGASGRAKSYNVWDYVDGADEE